MLSAPRTRDNVGILIYTIVRSEKERADLDVIVSPLVSFTATIVEVWTHSVLPISHHRDPSRLHHFIVIVDRPQVVREDPLGHLPALPSSCFIRERKWMPCKTRASTISFATSEKRSYVRVFWTARGLPL